MKKKNKKSFFRRFFNFRGLAFRTGLLFLIGIVIVFLIAATYILAYTSKIMLDEAEKDASDLTSLNISRIESILNPVEDLTQNLANSLSEPSPKYAEIHNIARNYVRFSPIVFGSCLAFEPYGFNRDAQYYAPYIFEGPKGITEKMLGGKRYNYFDLDWYKEPKRLNKPCWSEPYYDKGGGDTLMCTYSVPVSKMVNGKSAFAGVFTMDISLAAFEKIVSSVRVYKTGFGFLVSRSGKIIATPERRLMNHKMIEFFDTMSEEDSAREVQERKSLVKIEINEDNKSFSKKLKAEFRKAASEGGDPDTLRTLFRKMLRHERGFLQVDNLLKDGRSGWVYYAPVASTGWYMMIAFPSDELFSGLLTFIKKLGSIILFSIIAILIVTIFVVRRFTRPIVKLTNVAYEIGQGDFQAALPPYKGRNEIAQLTQSFAVMQRELVNYIDNLRETTAIKEKIESELAVAHEIQVGMLPKRFPDKQDCDLYAILEPARAVGGDVYDFFFLDHDHLFIGIGDVSGKGVPAALFMAITRTLFRAKVVMGMSLHSVMESINVELCKDNPNVMFVTFQVVVLNIRTGQAEICNAGHNYPVLMRADSKVEKYHCKPGLPLGVMEDATYISEEFTLLNGEKIVMYTDGITEATNITEDFYKEDKLMKILKAASNLPSKETANIVIENVKAFSGLAEQSDDITLLIVQFTNPGTEKKNPMNFHSLTIKNQLTELEKIMAVIDDLSDRWKFSPKTALELNLVLEELVTNIIFYAFDDKDEHPVHIDFSYEEGQLRVEIRDGGKPFNLLEVSNEEEFEKPLEERKIGGLGIHFVRSIMDEVAYERKDDENVVILTKKV